MKYNQISEMVSETMYNHYKQTYPYIIESIIELKKRGETKETIQAFITKKFGRLNQTQLTLNSAIEFIFKKQ